MTWLLWLLIPLAYFMAGAWFWRQFAWRVAWKEASEWSHPGRIDGGNVGVGIFLGALQAAVWPITLFALRGVRTEAFYGFLREPGKSKKQRELEQREARIAELERELNIR